MQSVSLRWRLVTTTITYTPRAAQLSMDNVLVPGGCPFAAADSICSSFSSVIDLIGRIFGLHSTSLRLPFSEYTNPALGRHSCKTGLAGCGCSALDIGPW